MPATACSWASMAMAVMQENTMNSTLHNSSGADRRPRYLVCIARLRTLCVVSPGDCCKMISYPRCFVFAENSLRDEASLEYRCTYSELKCIPPRDQHGEVCPVCATGLFQDVARAISDRVLGD